MVDAAFSRLVFAVIYSLVTVTAFGQVNPKEQVKTLEVIIKTSNEIISGTSNDVWIDLGPKAWKYKDGFNRGETKSITFDPNNIDPDGSLENAVVPLLVEDIYQIRIEKKGLSIPGLSNIGGITNAPDNLADELIGPVEILPMYQNQLAQAKTLLDQKQELVNKQKDLIDLQINTINDAENIINNTANVVSALPIQLANAQNDLINIQNQLVQTPMKITHQVCNTVNKWGWKASVIGFLTGQVWAVIGTEVICHNEEVINDTWTNLTNSISGAAQTVNSLQAQIQQQSIQRASAIQSKVTAVALKTSLEAQKIVLDADYVIARSALDVAQSSLDEINNYITNILPKLPIDDIPRLNQWKPESITLKVNGNTLSTFTINTRLKKGKPSWTGFILNISNEEKFVKGLRVNKNTQGHWVDARISRVTTPALKFNNVSGWEAGPVNTAEVIGTLIHEPSPGDDAYVSFDLQVEEVTVNGRNFQLDGNHGINHLRYIRIEHKKIQPNGSEDTRYKSWHVGKRIKVNGVVKRDTDRITYYEIHPDNAKGIKAFNGLFFF